LGYSSSAASQAEIDTFEFRGKQQFIGMYAQVDLEQETITSLGMLVSECTAEDFMVEVEDEETEGRSGGFAKFILFVFIWNIIGLVISSAIIIKNKFSESNAEDTPPLIKPLKAISRNENTAYNTSTKDVEMANRSDTKMLDHKKSKYSIDDEPQDIKDTDEDLKPNNQPYLQ